MRTAIERRLETLAAPQLGVFHRQQAIAIGFTPGMIRWRVQNGAWLLLGHAVYRLAAAPPSHRQSAWAAVLAAGSTAAVSHRTAALLHGMPGPWGRRIEVSKLEGSGHWLRGQGSWLHETCRLPPHHVTTIEGLPVTTVARTIFDLAGVVRDDLVERVLDDSLAAGRVRREALLQVLDDLAISGLNCIVLMLYLLDRRGDGYVAPESALEARFRRFVSEMGLPEPVWQFDAGGAAWIGRADAAYPDAKLLIELDSRRHHTALLDWERDHRRDQEWGAAGFRVLRIHWHDLDAPERLAAVILGYLRSAA